MVEKDDVNEAMRLMEMSKDSLNNSDQNTRFVTPIEFHNSSDVLHINVNYVDTVSDLKKIRAGKNSVGYGRFFHFFYLNIYAM